MFYNDMRISNFAPQTNNTNFKSCNKKYINKTVNNVANLENIYTTTNLFRKDLNWLKLPEALEKIFKGKNKVNIYDLACSDGSEAYTIAISIMQKLPNSKKYFPIKASDINDEMIDIAKSGKINISDKEIKMLKTINSADYFEHSGLALDIKDDLSSIEKNGYKAYKAIPELKNKIEFKKNDILSEIQTIDDKSNSVIFCRNVSPYLSLEYINSIIQTLQQKLKKGSLFVIGHFDSNAMKPEILKNDNFKEIGKNVFIKL